MKSLIRKLLREGLIKESLISSPLYHGTKYNFDKFDLKFFNSGSGDGGWLGRGIYLTNDYEYAESYGNVLECTVNIKNPYIITDYVYSRSPEKLANDLGVNNSREITSKLIKEGYDSVILTYSDNGYTKDGEYDKFIEICVFEPNNIRVINGPLEEEIITEKSINDISIKDFNKREIISQWMLSNPDSVYEKFKYEIQDDYYLSPEEKDEIMGMDYDDIHDLPRFKKWLDYEVESVIEDSVYNIKSYIKNGLITVWRDMTVTDEWLKALPTTGARLGRYWSFEEDAAEAHWGGSESNRIKIQTTVPETYIDWQQTITANIDPAIGEDEKEITLFKNTPIKIDRLMVNGKVIDISNIKNKTFKV